VKVRFIWRNAIRRDLVRVYHRHVGYFDPLIVGFIIVAQLRLYGHNVTSVGKVSPATNNASVVDLTKDSPIGWVVR